MPFRLDHRLKILDFRQKSKIHHLSSKIFPQRRPGFTLIEILVVVGIMAVLAGALLYSTNNARDKGKDARRKDDLKAVATALVAYYTDNKTYPPNSGTQTDYASLPYNSDWIPGLSAYLSKMPKDPLQAGILTQFARIFNNSSAKAVNPVAQTQKKGQVAGVTTATFTLQDGTHDRKREPADCLVNSPVDSFGRPYPDYGGNGQPLNYPNNGLREAALHYSVIIPSAQVNNIINARIIFNPRDDAGWGGDTNPNVHVKISAQKGVLNAPNPPCNRNPVPTDWTSITRTAFANWDPPAWIGYGDDGPAGNHTYAPGISTTTDDGTYTNGKNFTDVIKEVLTQPLWSGGTGQITIFIEDNGSAIGAGRGPFSREAFTWVNGLGTGGDGVGPKLEITYGSASTSSLTASQTNITEGQSTVLTWTSSGATTCSISPAPATGSWPSSPPNSLNGSQTTGNLTVTITYTLMCDGGASDKSVTITVNPIGGGGGGGSVEACNPATPANFYCYRTSTDRKVFVLWTQLENLQDTQISSSSTASCTDSDFTVSGSPFNGLGKPANYFNYCIKSPQ